MIKIEPNTLKITYLNRHTLNDTFNFSTVAIQVGQEFFEREYNPRVFSSE